MSKATSTNAQPGFIPPDLEIKDWSDLQPYYEALLAVKIQSAADLEDFLVNYSELDRKSTRLNSSHIPLSRMPSSA